MSGRVALHPYNKDAASARGRSDVQSRSRSVGKEQTSVQPKPLWKPPKSGTVRETHSRLLQGGTARTTQGKAVGSRVPRSAPESRFPSAPAPTPRTLTPLSANERRRPPIDCSQQKFFQILQPNSTTPPSVGRKSLKDKAKSPRRDNLSNKGKGRKKSRENDNYPEAMKSAENSTSSLITNIMKSNRRKEKECPWKLLNNTMRSDDMPACIPAHSVPLPKGLSYNTVLRKQQRRGGGSSEREKTGRADDTATLKSIDPAIQEIELITIENEDYRDFVNSRLASVKGKTPKSKNSKDVPTTRFLYPASVRRTTIGGKTETLKGAAPSEGAASTRAGNTGRRDRTSPKVMDKPTEKPSVSPRQTRPSMSNRTSFPQTNGFTEEGVKKRSSKTTFKDLHLISYFLPSIPEGKPSDGGHQSYYNALRNLVTWKDSVRSLDSKITQASAVAAVSTTDKDLPFGKAKERSQGTGQKSTINASRTVSDKIRSSYVKPNNLLLLHGPNETLRIKPRRKTLYPKELMSASDSESESKVKYNPSYIHPSVSRARANNFKRFLNFNIVLPGSSADIYPWYMSNDRVHNPLPKTKRTI